MTLCSVATSAQGAHKYVRASTSPHVCRNQCCRRLSGYLPYKALREVTMSLCSLRAEEVVSLSSHCCIASAANIITKSA